MEDVQNQIKEEKKNRKSKKYIKDDYLKEAKVFRLSVYDTEKQKIMRTPFVYSLIQKKEDVLKKLKKYVKNLEIPAEVTIYTLGDGAPWVKDVLDSLHSNTIFILDFYHAASYVSKVAQLKILTKVKKGAKKSRQLRSELKSKGGKIIVKRLKVIQSEIKESRLNVNDKKHDLKIISGILKYLEPRIEQMHYKTVCEMKVPIGSGFIESACKQIIKQRLGLSGGRFYLEAAERIMMLRCLIMMEAWEILIQLMYEKEFEVRHCKPSSSYEAVLPQSCQGF